MSGADVTRVLPISAETYERHPLHRTERIWTETNCYVDLWIELLHALGLDPLAASAFALATDFEGDQWTFFKFPPEDLREVFGIRVYEVNQWRGVLDHVLEHLEAGRLITVEVDGWFLPDTAGVSYRSEHPKTTIVPNQVDVEGRRLGYFHNASYYELEGDDFDGVFRLGDTAAPEALGPYLETVRVDRLAHPSPAELVERSRALLRRHVAEMPDDNPVVRFQERLPRDLGWLRTVGMDGFHRWAFGALRQFGASAEVSASYLEWLDRAGAGFEDLPRAVEGLETIAADAKALQFQLARAARGREVDVDVLLSRLGEEWDAVHGALVGHVR